MLPRDAVIQEAFKEVNELQGPLAIGVTLGGLLLDVIAPRPKPRTGPAPEPPLTGRRPDPRTPRSTMTVEEHERLPVVSGVRARRHVG
jgi:hypothetical protein